MKSAFKAIVSLLIVVTLFFALSVAAMPALITSVSAQQTSAEELSTAAKTWEEDMRVLREVLDKAKSEELISDADYENIEEALNKADSLESFISSVDSLTVEIDLEKVYSLESFAIISSIVERTFGNERMNIYVTLEDGGMLNFCVIIRDAKIAKLKTGEIINPTIKVYTTEHALRSIMDSSDSRAALQVALKGGDITYEGVGILNKGKFFVPKLASKAYGLLEPSPFEIKEGESKAIEYEGKQATLNLNPKNVRYVEFQDENEIIIIDKYGCEKGYTTKNNLKLMQADPKELTPVAGIYTKPVGELRLKATCPEITEIKRLMQQEVHDATTIINKTFSCLSQ